MLSVHSFVFRDMASPFALLGWERVPTTPCLFLCMYSVIYMQTSFYSLFLSLVMLSFCFHSPAVAFQKDQKNGMLVSPSALPWITKLNWVRFFFFFLFLFSLSKTSYYPYRNLCTLISLGISLRFVLTYRPTWRERIYLVNCHNACHFILFFEGRKNRWAPDPSNPHHPPNPNLQMLPELSHNLLLIAPPEAVGTSMSDKSALLCYW